MPCGLIHEQHGMRTWRDRLGDFGEMQAYCFGVAKGKDEHGTLPLFRADGAVDIS